MQLSGVLGWTATALLTLCYIPQIIKTSTDKVFFGAGIFAYLSLFVSEDSFRQDF